ncbi:ADP-heptose--LPS heptosyltransferase RfaF [Arsenophonus nasoniae]|uniref:Lipopolysaccharide heptosyltransferase 2 n=1 Tax=Arsenophonus nasoniae TaxID=638 RepID=D2U329_9GAMM|nr:ADP-heptose--LPS heptosyltransferase RfaF [Arsenophonus nasoniae]QBY42224.1 ADP-heptose--LPS heptosyltransferase 2 [Arsenophonus nasoniae]WGL95345.1 ADP-heptose--LPS heptosyltransferase RfaF [Arsenophonus nasoniae]WGM02116.1 ADP-heptose--LPS heptosyltransferase RfaF [Arsenophonus nasoniae]WGM06381.1 ADP-heptose--LPS heptosyltransferase RfaF [Arsenophonus nasoniae]WGM11314.1 ADP-heptose--LPS heptosyltransferase RfaF [Arsenophonus nasoniae]
MKILVVGPSWVGDMMMSQSLYRTLKTLHPEAEIDVMAPDWCRPLLNKMSEVNQAISMPLGHGRLAISLRRQLGIQLRTRRYDQAYILPNSFKSALVPFFAQIPIRTGWRGEMRYWLLNDIRLLDKAAFPQMVQRYVALAYKKDSVNNADELPKPILWPQLSVTEREISQSKRIFHIPAQLPIIGFCPGAEFGPAKRWPAYHYAELAQLLVAVHGYQILIFGSQKDRHIGEDIRQSLSVDCQQHCFNLAGKTTLEQAVNLLASCRAVVSNDSGLMHIAAALNRPLVALYGPSSPDFTPPLTNRVEVIRLITGYHKVRTGSAESGYHQSLIDIKPERVMTALTKLLAESQ